MNPWFKSVIRDFYLQCWWITFWRRVLNQYFQILFAYTRIKNCQRRRLKWAVSINTILFGFKFLFYFCNGFPLELWFTYWTSVWTSPNRSDNMSGSIPSLKFSQAEFWLEASSDSLKIIWSWKPRLMASDLWKESLLATHFSFDFKNDMFCKSLIILYDFNGFLFAT